MDNDCGMESILSQKSPTTMSVAMVEEAGKKLGLSKEDVDEISKPQGVHIYRLHTNMLGRGVSIWGCTVFHNKARGPYKGGIRIAADINVWEVTELARLMTLKTSLVELEFGGAKTGIRFDVKKAYADFGKAGYDKVFEGQIKRAIINEYASAYRETLAKHRYVPAPDMGTGPNEMMCIYNLTNEPSSVTGKPEGIPGWLPGRKEATGYGCCFTALEAMKELKIEVENARVAVQGFGNVGSYTAKFLKEKGAKVIAITDSLGGAYDENGLDVDKLMGVCTKTGTIKGCAPQGIANEQLFALDVDVLIPAACGGVITENNAGSIKARAIVEGANMPTEANARPILRKKNILVIPDILANSGGVIASGEEYSRSLTATRMKKEEVFKVIEEKIGDNLKLALQKSRDEKIDLTEACTLIAVERVHDAMKKRGWL